MIFSCWCASALHLLKPSWPPPVYRQRPPGKKRISAPLSLEKLLILFSSTGTRQWIFLTVVVWWPCFKPDRKSFKLKIYRGDSRIRVDGHGDGRHLF